MSRPRPADALVAVAMAGVAQSEVWLLDMWRGPRPVDAVVAALPPLMLAVARRNPLAGLVAGWAVYVAESIAYGAPEGPSQALTMFILVLGCAAIGGERRWLALPVMAAGLWVSNLTDPDVDAGGWIFPLVFYGVGYALGTAIRRRDERSQQLEREQETIAQAAVLDERVRIARELHDVVAHGISVMVVQAVGGRAALADPDHPSSGAFDAIESTGKQSLAEMRRLLGVLRTVDDSAMLLPQPGLRDLEPLVRRARDSGLRVALEVEGEPRRLPAGIDLSAYRVLQEALTNAIKHAGRAQVAVRVRYGGDTIAVEVSDDGPGAASANGGGHGLIGMRERVELFGGRLHTGPGPEGGYVVRAELPVEHV